MNRPLLWSDAWLHPQALDLIAKSAELTGPWQLNPSEIVDPWQGLENADVAVISSRLHWNASAFARYPRLKAVCRAGIGYDRVDVADATLAGVVVTNTPDAPTESTAEHAIALMLNVAKRVKVGDHMLVSGKIIPRQCVGMELLGKTLGLVGLGRIGARVAQIAQVLGMHVLAYDPYLPMEKAAAIGVKLLPTLDELLAQAEVVSLHSPLTPATKQLIGARQLALMKPGAILINCSRGPVVDEAALYQVLQSGHLGGAGLDVWDPEPPSLDNPLLGLENVVGTPHVASNTQDGLRKMSVAATEQALMVLHDHKPPNLLNPEVWETRRR